MIAIERRRRIAELLRSQVVSSQGDLVEALNGDGANITQATISRDLRAMGVVKGPTGYLPIDSAVTAPLVEGDGSLKQHVLSMEPADSLLVVRTRIGHANAVAVMLDRMRLDEMVGTIAGDDTIFIATTGRSAVGRLRRELATILDMDLDA